MKKLFVAVGSTASNAVIELARRCRDENLDNEECLARDFKYITIDTVPDSKSELEKLYPNTTRVYGIHLSSEEKNSSVLETLLAVRGEWRGEVGFDYYGAYGDRRKSAATRTWVSEVDQCLKNWKVDLRKDKWEVLVVGTACGATCTGMFWDVASYLRSKTDVDTGGTTVCGVVCLPELDYVDTTRGFIYPTQQNFCAFMQDMRQIAILNSLRRKRVGDRGLYFRPVSFKKIEPSTTNWEDSKLHLFDGTDIRPQKNPCCLPVDAMFFLPPPMKEAVKNFADHLFVYASIYHYTGAGGQQDNGNAAIHGGVFGGLHLAVATSPLFAAIQKSVQDKWQGIRSSFLSSQEVMDERDKETIAKQIRPKLDWIPSTLTNHLRAPTEWFADWVDSVQAGKNPTHRLEEIQKHLFDCVKVGSEEYTAYTLGGEQEGKTPIPFKFFGKNSFTEKIKGDGEIKGDSSVWECLVRESGIKVTLQGLKDVYLQVCEEIKNRGDLEQKTQDMLKAMKNAKEKFSAVSKARKGRTAVKAFGQDTKDAVQNEINQSFKDFAEVWFSRMVDICLMYFLSRKLPGKDQLEREIAKYSQYITAATSEVLKASSNSDLEQRITVTRKDVLSKLFEGMKVFDEKTERDTIVKKYKDTYDAFVSQRVADVLKKLDNDSSFDKAPFIPRFNENILGYSEVFKRDEASCTKKETGKLVKHICKHAGDIQKPTYGAVWNYSPSFKSLKPDAEDSDSFDPFASGEPRANRISERTGKDNDHKEDCYFGELQEVPSTFLRMWLGVLALDKPLPDVLSDIYQRADLNAIEHQSRYEETGSADSNFARLINLRESVEIGVVLGYVTGKMNDQVQHLRKSGLQSVGEMHLKRTDNMQEIVTWSQKKVGTFWQDNELKTIDARTLKNLLTWLREVNARPESEKHLIFWNEQDWIPLTSTTFVFGQNDAFMERLADLEQYLCSQLDVQFDAYRDMM